MNKVIIIFALCFFCIGLNQIAAQPSIFIEPTFQLVNEGDNVTLDITTNDFTDIQVIRFTLDYDSDVLTYTSATFNPAVNIGAGCSVDSSTPNRLVIECAPDPDCDASPVTLPDGVLLSTLNFTAVNGYTEIFVIDDPLDIEYNYYVQRICSSIGLFLDDPVFVAVDNQPITINVPDVNVNESEQFCLEFELSDFEDIVSMQYSIGWDANVLQFVSVNGFNLPGISSSAFNYNPATETLLFTWNDPLTQGVTLPDGTAFTQICFDVIGACGDNTTIQIQSLPTPVEVTNLEDPGQDIGYLDGEGTVSVNCNNPNGLGLTIFEPSQCVNPGESFTICTEVSNFNDLEVVDFTINWNPDVISANAGDVSLPSGLAGLGVGQLSTGQMGQGFLGISWEDPTCNGQTLADGVDLICIDFTSVGEGGVNSSIFISGSLEPINVMDNCNGSNNLGVNSQNSLVEICEPNGITLSAADFVVDPGDQICVPINVQDFENIEEMQFSVAWDNTILSYSNTQNEAIPGITFDESFQSFGGLCLSWDGGGTPQSLPDGSTLFEVCFDAIGGPFNCSEISFPQFPCVQEVITSESNGFSVDINGQAGEVCMDNPNALAINIGSGNGLPGDLVCVDFEVVNFVSLAELTFTVEWDNTVLDYVELQNPGNLPNFDTDSYSDVNASNGFMTVDWNTVSAFGNSLANNSSIFSLCFNPIGGSGDCSDIIITSTFEPIGAYSAFSPLNNIGINVSTGLACIQQFVLLNEAIVTGASCTDVPDGAIMIDAIGGTGNFNYFWYDSDGVLISVDEDLVDAPTGNYTLVIQDALNPNLDASFDLSIGLDSSAPIADAGMDDTLPCDSPFGTLDGSGSSVGANYTYEWTDLGPTNNVFPTDVLVTQVFGPGEYMLAVTDNNTGCTILDTIIMSPVVFPAAELSFANADSVLNCVVGLVEISSENSSNYNNDAITYTWMTEDGSIDTGTENDENISVTVPGTYVLEIENINNTCASTDTIIVVLDDIIPMAEAGSDLNIDCINNTATLDGSASEAGTNIVYEWTGPNGDNIPTLGSTAISAETVSAPGTYTILVSNTVNGCSSIDTLVLIADTDLPIIDVETFISLDCDTPVSIIDASLSSSGPDFEVTWLQGGTELTETDLILDISTADIYTIEILNTTNNCESSEDIIVADSTATPMLNALIGLDAITCLSSTVEIDGSDSEVGSHIAYLWTGPSVINGSEINQLAEVDAPGEYTFNVTNTNTGCSSSESITIDADTIASEVSDLNIIAGNLAGIITCYSDELNIGLNVILDSVDEGFEIIWAGPCIDATNELQPVIDCAGTSYIQYTNLANGCVGIDSFAVTADLQDPVIQSISSSITEWICSTTEANLQVTTDALNPGDYSYEWLELGCGADIIVDNGDEITVSGPCDYSVIVTNPINGCDIEDQFTIEANVDLPVIEDVLPTAVLNCDPQEAAITASSPTGNVDFEWTLNNSVVSSLASFNATELGTYVLTVTNLDNDCVETAATEVIPADNPTVSAGSSVEFDCLTDEVDLVGSSINDVTYTWSGPCVVTSNNETATVDCPGIYTLTVVDNITGCEATDETEVIETIGVDLADISNFSDPCSVGTIEAEGNIPQAGVTGQWVITPSVSLADPTDAILLLSDLNNGVYNLEWILSTANCPEYSSSAIQVEVLEEPVANDDELEINDDNLVGNLDLLDNDLISSGYTYTVNIVEEPTTGEFTLTGSEVQYIPSALLFSGEIEVPYEICIADCPDLCSVATLNIVIDRSIDPNADFPNAITPNGDGLNDAFIFDLLSANLDKYPNNEMTIFNRWGDVVYSAAPYMNDWGGQNNQGNDLPEGTYYYVLILDVANGLILKGDITILR